MSDPEKEAFFASMEKAAKEVRTWPKWKRDLFGELPCDDEAMAAREGS
jgi:hypothetical protein